MRKSRSGYAVALVLLAVCLLFASHAASVTHQWKTAITDAPLTQAELITHTDDGWHLQLCVQYYTKFHCYFFKDG